MPYDTTTRRPHRPCGPPHGAGACCTFTITIERAVIDNVSLAVRALGRKVVRDRRSSRTVTVRAQLQLFITQTATRHSAEWCDGAPGNGRRHLAIEPERIDRDGDRLERHRPPASLPPRRRRGHRQPAELLGTTNGRRS